MKTKQPRKLALKTILKQVQATNKDINLGLEDWQLESVAQTLKDINDILSTQAERHVDHKLFALCEKTPKNLDSGRHYFSVRYIKNGEIHKAWFWEFIAVFGGYDQSRDRNMDKYVFGSDVIGMSRVLDSTNGLFNYLKAIGGFYIQLHCIN